MSKKAVLAAIEKAKRLEQNEEPLDGDQGLLEDHEEFERETKELNNLLKKGKNKKK